MGIYHIIIDSKIGYTDFRGLTFDQIGNRSKVGFSQNGQKVKVNIFFTVQFYTMRFSIALLPLGFLYQEIS